MFVVCGLFADVVCERYCCLIVGVVWLSLLLFVFVVVCVCWYL